MQKFRKVRRVPRQPRDLKPKNDAGTSHADFGHQLPAAVAVRKAGKAEEDQQATPIESAPQPIQKAQAKKPKASNKSIAA